MTDAALLGPGDGRSFSVGFDRVTVRIEAAATQDAFSLVEYEAAPGIPGPPLHIHRVVQETFFILDGEVEFRAAGRKEVLTRGAVAFVPPGIPHTFANVGAGPARWVGIFAPGRYVAILEELGRAFPGGGGPPDEAKLMAAFAANDVEIVPEG
jgi:quercetin dioxygenase-like cupin family protein